MQPPETRVGAVLAGWRIGAAVAGAAALHVALAAIVGGQNQAGSPHPAALASVSAPIQVRSVAATISATPAAMPSAPDGSQSTGTGGPAAQDPKPQPGQHYFDASEVDAPAMPLPEWQVDVPILMIQGVRGVSVDVWISEAGVAQQCAVTRIEPQQSPALQVAVASKLCETVLRPAQRRGVAVASVRHIELVLATD